jgi:hypothetical protein
MDRESHWQQFRPALGACRRARLAAWNTAMGIALSSVTVTLSALDAISDQQAIAMALPAVQITVAGVARRIVPDARIAWRRGFRHGCEAAPISQPPAYVLRTDDASSRLGPIRLGRFATYPTPRYCAVCGQGCN